MTAMSGVQRKRPVRPPCPASLPIGALFSDGPRAVSRLVIDAPSGKVSPNVEVDVNPTPTLPSESISMTDSATDPDTSFGGRHPSRNSESVPTCVRIGYMRPPGS